jgi:hypothetical protein
MPSSARATAGRTARAATNASAGRCMGGRVYRGDRASISLGRRTGEPYNFGMSDAPEPRRDWPISIRPLHDPAAGERDRAYWMSRTPAERMAALDRLREERDGPQPRLARVARVVERKRR